MPLPRQARQQVAHANEILARMHQNDEHGEAPELSLVEEHGAELQSEAVVKVEAEEEKNVGRVVEPAEIAEGTTDEKPRKEQDEEDFAHKYRVLQGKYNNEVPRLSKQISDLREEIAQMASLLEAKEQETAPVQRLISDDEIEEFGPELLDLIGRKAQEISQKENKQLKSELAELKTQLTGVTRTVGKTAREKLLDQLDQKVENWEVLNTDAEFLDWLDNVDPYSGQSRGKMLKQAYESNDAQRVIAFFTGFQKEHAAVAPKINADPAPSVIPAVDLNEQVAPGRTARTTAPASAQNAKRIWTKQQMAHFYSDVQHGKYKGKEAEKTSLEKDLFNAMAEGRIRQ